MTALISWLWSDEFYYGKHITWEEVNSTSGIRDVNSLYMVFPIFIALTIFRIFFERFLAKPFCEALGVKNANRQKAVDNSVCEKVHKSTSGVPSNEKINKISNDLNWSPKQVQQWFRRRRNMQVPSKMTKATESCWKYCAYSALVIYGLVILLPKDYFWDTKKWWRGHPFQVNEGPLVWYHVMEIALYMTFSYSQFQDVYRKDFWQMLIHHIITIILLVGSFFSNSMRLGSMIILVHDFSDPLLEAAKIFNYAGWQNACDGMFVFFAVVFGITRLIVFPFWIIRSNLFESWQIGAMKGNTFYTSNGLFLSLQVLHIFWAYTIGKMAYSFIVVGKCYSKYMQTGKKNSATERVKRSYVISIEVAKDQRSEGESSTEAEDEKVEKPLNKIRSTTTRKRSKNKAMRILLPPKISA